MLVSAFYYLHQIAIHLYFSLRLSAIPVEKAVLVFHLADTENVITLMRLFSLSAMTVTAILKTVQILFSVRMVPVSLSNGMKFLI